MSSKELTEYSQFNQIGGDFIRSKKNTKMLKKKLIHLSRIILKMKKKS